MRRADKSKKVNHSRSRRRTRGDGTSSPAPDRCPGMWRTLPGVRTPWRPRPGCLARRLLPRRRRAAAAAPAAVLHLRADVTGRRRGPLAVRARVPRGTGLGVAQAAPRGSGRRCGPTARAPCRHGAWRCRCGGRRSTAVHGGQHWHKDAGVGPCCSGRGRGAGSTAAAEDGTRGSVGTPGSGSRRSSGSGSGSTAALVCSSRSGVGG